MASLKFCQFDKICNKNYFGTNASGKYRYAPIDQVAYMNSLKLTPDQRREVEYACKCYPIPKPRTPQFYLELHLEIATSNLVSNKEGLKRCKTSDERALLQERINEHQADIDITRAQIDLIKR